MHEKTLLVFLCMLVLGLGVHPVHALQPIRETPIPDIDLFAVAMGDEEIADYHEQCRVIMIETDNWDIFQETPPFADRYAPLLEVENWLLLQMWQERIAPIGYLPVPVLDDLTLADNGRGSLKYTGSTTLGKISITFSFLNGNAPIDYYQDWCEDETRARVSRFTMRDGEKGVFSFASSGRFASCKSCTSDLTGKGRASLAVPYDDMVMHVPFANDTTEEETIAFMQELEIEKRAIGPGEAT